MKELKEEEIKEMIRWEKGRGMDVKMIEKMKMGEIEFESKDKYMKIQKVSEDIERKLKIEDIKYRKGGNERYVKIREKGGRIGLIKKMKYNL